MAAAGRRMLRGGEGDGMGLGVRREKAMESSLALVVTAVCLHSADGGEQSEEVARAAHLPGNRNCRTGPVSGK